MVAIDELAARYGIQAVSEDAFGKEHVTSVETKRALLHAMHVEADTEEAVRGSLQRLDEEENGRALPPVVVVYRARAMRVPVALPKQTGEIVWTVVLENGEVRTGQALFSELAPNAEGHQAAEPLEKRMLPLPNDLPDGYHTLSIDQSECTCSLIVTPGVCWLPDAAGARKLWGFVVQLYLLKSKANWGMGDFSDLCALVRLSLEQGADVVGLNPLHAMFPDEPEQASPYSPSDRLLLNTLYIDVQQVPELVRSAEAQAMIAAEDFQTRQRACRDASIVQYTEVAESKMSVLRILFAEFRKGEDLQRAREFEDFRAERPELLDRACLFQALRDHFTQAEVPLADCKDWPQPYRDLNSAEVKHFQEEHGELIRFHMWLQWVADAQLRAASEACKGMAIGLYRDLAVGCDSSGAEVWSHPEAMVPGASVGAPPDIWNPAGQNWGLPPLHPHAAQKDAYASFIELVRANMRYAGALRIDHALALRRLYWIPKGAPPSDGAYVEYPIEDLVGILALESSRNKCVVIGEDLGTVPKGFRERMASANILSYRVLFFERDDERFIDPREYPQLSLSVASSHDLPTLRGWWVEADLDAKDRLGLFPTEENAGSARTQRLSDREALLAAFRAQDLEVPSAEDGSPEQTFIRSAHRLLGRTSSFITLLQLDDLTAEIDQVNIPGTTTENQNWRRKLSMSLEDLRLDPSVKETGSFMREA